MLKPKILDVNLKQEFGINVFFTIIFLFTN